MKRLHDDMQKAFRFLPCRMTWTPADNLHITLAFLGARRESQIKDFQDAAARAVAEMTAPLLEIKGLGVFPHWKRPSILWAGVRDRGDSLAALHRRLVGELEPLGFEPDERPFHPHVTLARFKGGKGVARAEILAHDLPPFRIGPFRPPALTLFKSELNPEGARHIALSHHTFETSLAVSGHKER